jgi:hypothetical protein
MRLFPPAANWMHKLVLVGLGLTEGASPLGGANIVPAAEGLPYVVTNGWAFTPPGRGSRRQRRAGRGTGTGHARSQYR